jgi:pyridoxine/pyridoxamine 5'-phosphate oxidase
MKADRPAMPEGYGIATAEAGQLPWAWAAERLAAARNYWIVTTRDDGRPHAMPVWGLWLDDAVLFSTDPQSVKGRNLDARPDLVIHLESGDETVIVEGRAERLPGAELPSEFVDAYDAKYGHRVDTSNPAFGFYRVAPERVLAWQEADFPTSATRFVREPDAGGG